LLTTCHLQNDRLDDLRKLIASADEALNGGEISNLRHIILIQGCTSAQRQPIEKQLPDWVELLSTEERLSSPVARNLMIRHLVESDGFDPDAFVGFPDDDAWYPKRTLACVARHFGGPADIQLLLTRYGPEPSAGQCGQAFRPTLQQALSSGACASIFVRAGLVAQLGGFHELLGLGTKLRGGEDTEFVHRAFHRAGGRVRCVPGFLVGHAAADPAKKALYYEGGLAALMAHSQVSATARLALLRKLAVGMWLVLRNRMSLAEYRAALRKARDNAPALRGGPSQS
jgi:hypothetical protein